MASKAREDIINHYDHFMKLNNEYVNEIRRLIKKQFTKKNNMVINDDNTELYNQITQINNELTNLQRRLTKTNKEVEYQKERYYATLKAIGEGVIALGRENNIDFINETAKGILGIGENNSGEFDFLNNIKFLDENDNEVLNEIINDVFKTLNL